MKIKDKLKNNTFLSAINSIYRNYFRTTRKSFGYIHPTAWFRQPILIKGAENVYMNERCSIMGHAKILTTNAKFVLKKGSGAAEGLTVVTGNHQSIIGKMMEDITDDDKGKKMDRDVIVDEDVWMATNVTLLAGVHVGRGAVIGSGSVCRSNVPPYAMVFGNPAKVIGFKFTPEEIIEHEIILYPENERIPIETLEKNYEKFYTKRIKKIMEFIK